MKHATKVVVLLAIIAMLSASLIGCTRSAKSPKTTKMVYVYDSMDGSFTKFVDLYETYLTKQFGRVTRDDRVGETELTLSQYNVSFVVRHLGVRDPSWEGLNLRVSLYVGPDWPVGVSDFDPVEKKDLYTLTRNCEHFVVLDFLTTSLP